MPAVTEKPRPRVSSEAFDRVFADLEQAVDVESDRLKSMTSAVLSGSGPWASGSAPAEIAEVAIDVASFVIKSIVWFEASLSVARVPPEDRRQVIGSINETAEILLCRGNEFGVACAHRMREAKKEHGARERAYRQTVFEIVHACDATVKAYLKLCGVKWLITEG